MDLGIKGKSAIVCAASKGLGKACATALAEAGVNLTICARGEEDLKNTAQEIQNASGVEITHVACDITTEAGRQAILDACPRPDILVNNAGGPPPANFEDLSMDDWRKAVEANMITPLALIKATVEGMMERKFGRIVNITSAAVKAPMNLLDLSNGARAGLTGGVAILARRASAHNVTINGMLPGTFETDRLVQNFVKQAEAQSISVEQAKERRRASVPANRFGSPSEFGAICAFLCSAHTGYITGQNIVIDGGVFPGIV